MKDGSLVRTYKGQGGIFEGMYIDWLIDRQIFIILGLWSQSGIYLFIFFFAI